MQRDYSWGISLFYKNGLEGIVENYALYTENEEEINGNFI